jgi:undecaprenyl-diphosphatase
MAALDDAALRGVTEAMRWLGGEQRLFLDWTFRHLVDIDLLKLGVPVLLAFWIWMRPAGYAADPVRVLRQIAGVLLAMTVARGAQVLLPDRPRPMQATPDFPFPELGHLLPINDGGSMPSDHAALAFSLAAVTWAAGSRRLGAVAFFWAALVVCLPRLYFGYHHLSDLVVGAAIGVAAVQVALRAPLPATLAGSMARGARRLDARAPGLASVALFLVAFECLTLFLGSRKMASAAATVAVVALGGQTQSATAAPLAAEAVTGPEGAPDRRAAPETAATAPAAAR